ncbi:hypothetical protein ACNKHO_25460 [Shigella flexneri]
MVQAYPHPVHLLTPGTLCQNLETFSQTHNLNHLALLNQFPTPTTWSAAYC